MKLKNLALTAILGLSTTSFAKVSVNFASEDIKEKELIVSFEEGITKEDKEALIADQGGVILKHFKTMNSALVRIPDTNSMLSTASLIADHTGVIKVGPNRVFNLLATTTNDPKINKQYHHDNIKSYDAWDISTGSKDVVVGVIDTGIVLDHEDLEANLWQNPGETGTDANGNDKRTNGIDDDGNGYVDDYQGWDFIDGDNTPNDQHGHGTHCAGLVGAVGSNGTGVAGVNWNVSVVALKIFGGSGSTSEAAIVEAIEYANMMGFDITNNSWGGPASGEWGEGGKDVIYEAIKAGGEKGHLFVFAAGNSGANSDQKPLIPGAYDLDSILSVAATTSRDGLANFSNYGVTTVDIGAPGAGIFSTIKRGFFGRQYGNMSGTSMAAPIVTGAAALVKAVNPSFSSSEIKEKLMSTADQVNSLKGKTVTGGRLNVYRAITE